MFLQLQIKVSILQFGFFTGTVCSEPSHLHSMPVAKNIPWRSFPLEMPGTRQPMHDRASAYGICLQKCSEWKYCHCMFKLFTWMSISETTWAEGLPSGSVHASSTLESSSPPKTPLPMGHSDPVTINRLWKSHETEWEMLEKQFQDVRISPLKPGSSLWKAIAQHIPPLSRIWGRLVIWSNSPNFGKTCLLPFDFRRHSSSSWSNALKSHIKSPIKLSWQISNSYQVQSNVPVWKQCGRLVG